MGVGGAESGDPDWGLSPPPTAHHSHGACRATLKSLVRLSGAPLQVWRGPKGQTRGARFQGQRLGDGRKGHFGSAGGRGGGLAPPACPAER